MAEKTIHKGYTQRTVTSCNTDARQKITLTPMVGFVLTPKSTSAYEKKNGIPSLGNDDQRGSPKEEEEARMTHLRPM